MRIFITGGTGFIGSNFINLAQKEDISFIALKNKNSIPRVKLSKSPEWAVGKMNDNWRDELSKCNAFLHMASYGVVRDSNNWEKCFKINVLESLDLWRQAISVGIKKFVIIGSCFEYGISGKNYKEIPTDAPLIPNNAYSASKASATIAAISLAIEYGLDLTVLRPFHVYGEGEDKERFWPTLNRCAEQNKNLEMTKGEQIRDFQYVGDTVKDILFYLLKDIDCSDPKVINLGTGKPKSLIKFAKEEWERIGAKGLILNGKKQYRPNEVMRFIPKL